VAAGQAGALVKFREPRGGAVGDKVRAQAGIAERAADDLLHFAFMQVNARTEHAPKLNSISRKFKRNHGLSGGASENVKCNRRMKPCKAGINSAVKSVVSPDQMK
jgi:hypothetical protein